MKINATEVKKIDNKLTYVIGYRNLLNIIVVAIGFVMMTTTNPTVNGYPLFGLIIFIIGLINWYNQFRDNLDATAVSEMVEEDRRFGRDIQ